MTRFPHLAQRLFNVPLAIRPEKAEIIVAALADRLGIGSVNGAPPTPMAFDQELENEAALSGRENPERGYDVVAGVAVIPIAGTLVQKLGQLRPYSGMTGYDGIRLNLLGAIADTEVEAIALDIDSPGGEVAGCFDLVDMIYAARGKKPIWAILNENAYSAAYAIASACDRITVPRTGGTGSVGVICMHVDFSKALDQAGVAVTLIHHGARKADGNEFETLPRAVLARIQADIDAMGELFVATVARNRGLDAKAVRDTEAATFLGPAGVAAKFADAVLAPDAAFRLLISTLD